MMEYAVNSVSLRFVEIEIRLVIATFLLLQKLELIYIANGYHWLEYYEVSSM